MFFIEMLFIALSARLLLHLQLNFHESHSEANSKTRVSHDGHHYRKIN
jgi:hypothetical protein